MGDLGIQIGLLILITLESGIQSLITRDKCICRLRRSRLGWGGVGAPGKAIPSDHGQAGSSERGILVAAIPGPHFHMVC